MTRGEFPMNKQGGPLGWRQRIRLFPPIHEAWIALALVGMRDRLRCPQCKAVGTWKPHGGTWNRLCHKDRAQRRWMCKYCGRYEGRDIGIAYVYPCPTRGCWTALYPWDPESPPEGGPTPADVVWRELAKVWPWWG